MSDSLGGSQISTYDAAGNLLTRRQTGNGGSLKLVYTYTADNQLASVSRYSDSAGVTLVAKTTYSYDSADRLVGIAWFFLTEEGGTIEAAGLGAGAAVNKNSIMIPRFRALHHD